MTDWHGVVDVVVVVVVVVVVDDESSCTFWHRPLRDGFFGNFSFVAVPTTIC